MKKILILALSVLAGGTGAYFTWSTYLKPATTASPEKPATTKEKPAEAPSKQTISEDKKAAEFTGLQKRFKELESDKPGILAQARGNEFCTAYERLGKYEELQADVEKAPLDKGDLKSKLETATKVAGKKAASLAYEQMLAGKSLTCKEVTGNLSETDIIEVVTKLMDKYGSESKRFESSVIRAAVIRTFKTGVNKALAELALQPESSEAQESLALLILNASQSKWRLSLQDLGVSISMKP
jgi:hypothetical protein